jgi:hypothetical protein
MSQDRSEPYLKRLLDWWVALLCGFGKRPKVAALYGRKNVGQQQLLFAFPSVALLPTFFQKTSAGRAIEKCQAPSRRRSSKMEPAAEGTTAPVVKVRPFQSDDGTALHQLEALCSQGKK